MRFADIAIVTGLLLATASAQGGAGGRYGKARATPPSEQELAVGAIQKGLDWLAAHQDEDGRWSASLFVRHDPKGAPCDGVGRPDQDFYVTSLALLAVAAEGSTLRGGPRRGVVDRATKYLVAQQADDGFLGPREPANAVAAHAIATFALAEVAGISGDEAVTAVGRATAARLRDLRRADGGWPRSIGGTSTDGEATLWSAIAMISATFFANGSGQCRDVPPLLAADPTVPPAAVVTVALFAGATPDDVARKAMLAALPQWPTPAQPTDFLGWFLGTLACYQIGGEDWDAWHAALLAASLPHQRTDGAFAGSWDPVDVRGRDGGRVAATALQVHALLVVQRRMQMAR